MKHVCNKAYIIILAQFYTNGPSTIFITLSVE